MHTFTTYPLTYHEQFMQYGENLAEECPDIKHVPGDKKAMRFFGDWDEIEGLNVKGMIMLMIARPMKLAGDNDSTHLISYYEITILQAAGSEKAKIDEAVKACLQVLMKIIKVLKYDSDPMRLDDRVFTYWRDEEVSIELLDKPWNADGWAGATAVVPMGTPLDLYLDINNKWV